MKAYPQPTKLLIHQMAYDNGVGAYIRIVTKNISNLK